MTLSLDLYLRVPEVGHRPCRYCSLRDIAYESTMRWTTVRSHPARQPRTWSWTLSKVE